MKKLLIYILFSILLHVPSIAQIQVDNLLDDEALVQSLVGNGVVINNVTVTAAPGSYGRFTGGNVGQNNINIASGVLLTSGSIEGAVGPNSNFNNINQSTDNDMPGNVLLDELLGNTETRDATVIEFDITPSGNKLSFRYVFGSEEYHDFVANEYNDIFGFFISGPGISGNKNIALIPNTNTPVSIHTINNGDYFECHSVGPGVNPHLFVDNCGGATTDYDGFTVRMTANTPTLIPCATYHITIAIADVKDFKWDSGVFIEAGGLTSPGGTNFTTNTNCNAGNWSVTATALDATVINNQWQLWTTNVAGATTGGTLVSTITGGLSATFNWLDLSHHYYIRHLTEGCATTETRIAVPNFSGNANASFNFEDENGVPKSGFCTGEDIYLDGSTSSNYDRFYLSAGRRPAGSAPGTPFTGYADYGWTLDNSIGVLNLSDEFLNHGVNPGEIFELGYEYEILLAISNPQQCIPWKEVRETFTVVCCDVNPAFSVQQGCNGGNWSVTATPNSSVQTNHLWQLYETNTQGTTTGGVAVGPAQNGTSATFSGLSITKFYYIKHGTGPAGCVSPMASVSVPGFAANATLAYVFEDKNGLAKDNFCYGEDIYLDATGTTNYDRYFISVWRRPIGSSGNFSFFADYGWTNSTNMGTLNLSQLMLNNGENPGEIFEPDYEYELQFAIANPPACVPWIELKKRFTVECCEGFFSAEFYYELREKPTGLEVRVFEFDLYSPYATHEWTVMSSPNANGGPYTMVNQTTTTEEESVILYSQGVSDLYYFVIHRVVTLCGEACYILRRKGHNDPGPDLCDICGPDDCSILDEICFVPGNLNIVCNSSFGLFAHWDAAPGVTNYWVQLTYNDPSCCSNGQSVSTTTLSTSNTVLYLGAIERSCFSWRVASVCESGPEWTVSQCFTGCLDDEDGPDGLAAPEGDIAVETNVSVLLYPNPADAQLKVVLPQGKTAEHIRLLDLHGRVVFEQHQPDQQLEIDCKELPAGLYTIQVSYPDRRQSVHKVQITH